MSQPIGPQTVRTKPLALALAQLQSDTNRKDQP